MFIMDGEQEWAGRMEGGGGGEMEGDYIIIYTYRYTVTTRMTPVSIKMGSDECHFKCFINCEGLRRSQDGVH